MSAAYLAPGEHFSACPELSDPTLSCDCLDRMSKIASEAREAAAHERSAVLPGQMTVEEVIAQCQD